MCKILNLLLILHDYKLLEEEEPKDNYDESKSFLFLTAKMKVSLIPRKIPIINLIRSTL